MTHINDRAGPTKPLTLAIDIGGSHLKGIVTAIRACGVAGGQVAKGMKKISFKGYWFPPEIIQKAIWFYVRFTLSFRDVEDLLAERGIMVSYETVRRWVNHFGLKIAADLRKRRPKPDTTWHLDEVYLKIDGRMVYLWRAVDAEGEVLDVLVQSRRNKRAALLFLDPNSYETVLTLGGFAPRVHELLIAPDRSIVYVPIYGDGIHGNNPHPGHLIALIDLKARRHKADFNTYPYVAPYGLRWGPQGQTAVPPVPPFDPHNCNYR
jgi:hypothetical protein